MKKSENNSKKAKTKKEKNKPVKKKSFEVDVDRLKEIIKEKEESGLEEEIEESEIITPEEVQHFIPSAQEKTAPVLRRVEVAESLEENVASTPIAKPAEDAGIINYSARGDYSSPANYSASSKNYEQERIAPMVLRDRRFDEENLQQRGMMSTTDEMQVHRAGRENEMIGSRSIEEKHGLPFEKRDRKYKDWKR